LDSFNGKTSPVLRKSYDVVVVGARIAGSTLAALLDGSGLSILFERRFAERIAAHEGLGQHAANEHALEAYRRTTRLAADLHALSD
jgi:flavin-dependent dehydrogenase